MSSKRACLGFRKPRKRGKRHGAETYAQWKRIGTRRDRRARNRLDQGGRTK